VAPRTITDPDSLHEELATIREQGYATDLEEIMAGLRGVAAPILDRDDGSVRGAITVYGPANRSDPDEYEESAADSLMQSANIIEVNLSYS
jgi:DNA-binding IclR family transcriptional regulator